jgi:hypothetical protein
MIGGFLSALIVTAGIGLAVWTSTDDPWVTGQAMGGAVVCAIGLGLAFDVLGKFGDGRDQVIDDTASLTTPSPTWLLPGLSSGDRSERHLRTRTHPALRELARRMILDRHRLDLDNPEHRREVERLLGSDIERLLRYDGAEHLGRTRKDADQSITAIVEGLERL